MGTCDFTNNSLPGFQPGLFIMNLFVLVDLGMCCVGHLNSTDRACVIQKLVCVGHMTWEVSCCRVTPSNRASILGIQDHHKRITLPYERFHAKRALMAWFIPLNLYGEPICKNAQFLFFLQKYTKLMQFISKKSLKVEKINIAHFWCILALRNILGG